MCIDVCLYFHKLWHWHSCWNCSVNIAVFLVTADTCTYVLIRLPLLMVFISSALMVVVQTSSSLMDTVTRADYMPSYWTVCVISPALGRCPTTYPICAKSAVEPPRICILKTVDFHFFGHVFLCTGTGKFKLTHIKSVDCFILILFGLSQLESLIGFYCGFKWASTLANAMS